MYVTIEDCIKDLREEVLKEIGGCDDFGGCMTPCACAGFIKKEVSKIFDKYEGGLMCLL